MQTWARRGIQTALVTGGLLMLGTSIASADEDVNPDRPVTPLGGSVIIPVNLDNNQIGTPVGTIVVPNFTPQPVTVTPPAVDDGASGVVPEGLDGAAAGPCLTGCSGTGDSLRGNRVNGDIIIPIDLSGNAIAAGGDVATTNNSDQNYSVDRPVHTSGHDFLAGNVLDIDWVLPVQISNNAVSIIGAAHAIGTANQSTSATGDIHTDGSGGTLAGNVLAAQGATPVQATGNAVSGLGIATADSQASTDAVAGGIIRADGQNGVGTGNVGAVPVAFPAEVNGNAVGAASHTATYSTHAASATAGREELGLFDRPTYIQTNGSPALAAGNVLSPAAAGPASAECNAATVAGSAGSECTGDSQTQAGGGIQTTGDGSVASGTVGNPSVALPTQGFANALAVLGCAYATQDNTLTSTAGGDAYTHGDSGVGSGTVASPSASTPLDVFTNAAAGAGQANANGSNTATTNSGGTAGTSGPNSVGGGNTANPSISLPGEVIGNTAAGAGQAASGATETKFSSSGGGASTADDAAVGAANVIQPAASGPAQVIGNGAGALGYTSSSVVTGSDVTAGGDNTAQGTEGVGSGNVGQAAAALPAQVIGSNATAGGIGTADGQVDTLSTAGGATDTAGDGGVLSGNVANAPAGSAVQGFGDSVAALGLSSADTSSTTGSTAGGDTVTTGTGGVGAGNVVSPQAMPIVQGFGDAVAGVGGHNQAIGDNTTDATSGGDTVSDGTRGTISGNLVNVPAAVAPQVFGDAVSAVGSNATGFGDNHTTGDVGGTSTTSGAGGFLSGVDGHVPAAVDAPVHSVPVEVLAQAMAMGIDQGDLEVGEGGPQVTAPLTDDNVSGLGITDAPRLPTGQDLTGMRSDRAMPQLTVLDSLGRLGGGLPMVGGPQAGRFANGTVPTLGSGGLPGVGSAPALPVALPGVPQVTAPGSLPVGMPAAQRRAGAPALPGLPVNGVPVNGIPVNGVPSLDNLSVLGTPNGVTAPALPGLAQLPVKPQLAGVPAAPGMPNVAPGAVKLPSLSDQKVPVNASDLAHSSSLLDTRSKLATLLDKPRI